jgi:glycosyltransferase involved in cell wall biosynthesis
VRLFTLFERADGRALLPADARFTVQALNGPKARSPLRVLWQLACAVLRLRVALHRERIDVLYSALNIANLIARAACLGTRRRTALAWSFHAAGTEPAWEDRFAIRACARLSGGVDAIVAVSDATREYLVRQGMPAARCTVVPNGTDTLRLHPDAGLRAAQRGRWGFDDGAFVLGVVARVVPVKAPERLLAALALACVQVPSLRAVWVGGGAADYIAALVDRARELGIADRVRFVGPSLDPAAAYNAFDAFALLSHSEGFGKVVAEAMAVALPCVVDRRAGAETLGDAGHVVDGDDPAAIARVLALLAQQPDERARLGAAARSRVQAMFSLARTLDATEALLQRVAAARPGRNR